jgi:hypothetical protein
LRRSTHGADNVEGVAAKVEIVVFPFGYVLLVAFAVAVCLRASAAAR